jgi:glycosyltransferase involved in cell wall biosynthesis
MTVSGTQAEQPQLDSATQSDGSVLIFVPTFNDHSQIQGIEDRIASLAIDARVLVVDDGSAVPVQGQASTLVFRLPDNHGLGVATNIAIDHALRGGYEALVRIDADGQHAVGDITKVLEPIGAGRADLVVGVRSNHMILNRVDGFLRSAVKSYFRIAARLATGGMAPRDVNSGFFALNREGMRVMNRFDFERYPEPQMFVLACRQGLRVDQQEITQLERVEGRSTLTVSEASRMVWRFTMFIANEVLGPNGRR